MDTKELIKEAKGAPEQSGLSESQIVLALSQHRDARPVVSGWPGPQWGKGWHGYCSCGWSGSPHGKDDAAKAQAQLDADYHVASVLLSVLS